MGCRHKDEDAAETVLVRVYGNKTDLLIDRKAETRWVNLYVAGTQKSWLVRLLFENYCRQNNNFYQLDSLFRIFKSVILIRNEWSRKLLWLDKMNNLLWHCRSNLINILRSLSKSTACAVAFGTNVKEALVTWTTVPPTSRLLYTRDCHFWHLNRLGLLRNLEC